MKRVVESFFTGAVTLVIARQAEAHGLHEESLLGIEHTGIHFLQNLVTVSVTLLFLSVGYLAYQHWMSERDE